MILYVEVRRCEKNSTLDYVYCTLPDGKYLLIDWSESSYSPTEDGFVARCKEVFFSELDNETKHFKDEEYADGKLPMLKDATLDMFGCMVNEPDEPELIEELGAAEIVSLEFTDCKNELTITKKGSVLKYRFPKEVKEK